MDGGDCYNLDCFDDLRFERELSSSSVILSCDSFRVTCFTVRSTALFTKFYQVRHKAMRKLFHQKTERGGGRGQEPDEPAGNPEVEASESDIVFFDVLEKEVTPSLPSNRQFRVTVTPLLIADRPAAAVTVEVERLEDPAQSGAVGRRHHASHEYCVSVRDHHRKQG